MRTEEQGTTKTREGAGGRLQEHLRQTGNAAAGCSWKPPRLPEKTPERDRGDMGHAADEVTRILGEVGRRPEAASELLPLVYDHLRRIAERRMREEREGHTLQATALVHEVFVKLVAGHESTWEGRAHFFRAAAQAMRRILIDHARRRDADKRGGRARPPPLSVVDLAEDHTPPQLIAMEEAMRILESEDPRAAEVVQFRFYAGLSVEMTAELLGISERTVTREWSFARARLYQLLGEPES